MSQIAIQVTRYLSGARQAVVAAMILALGPTGPTSAHAGSAFAVSTVRNLSYSDARDADPVRNRLDLFLPRGEKGFPVVFFVHGGAWQRGDKEFLGVYDALGTFFARHGIGAVVINYRLSPAVQHPEHIRDVARAFAWTHKHIAEYGGRPERLFVCGHSAGGHLVALLATDPDWLNGVGLKPDAIRGVISISGVYDLNGLPPRLAMRVFGKDSDVLTKASPTCQVRAGLPPFLILYADHDLPGCDQKPALAFAKALRAKSNKADVQEVAGSNHYMIILSAVVPGDVVCDAILSFIAAHASSP